MDDITVIVLAAGGGTRMKSKTMKVLHPIAGRSMLGHVLNAVSGLNPTRIITVVGVQREQVAEHIQAEYPDVVTAVQETQLGTGHAVQAALAAFPDLTGTVLVANGDTPLLRTESLQDLLTQHHASQHVMSILSGTAENPFGYGRIIRDAEDNVQAIVEEKDATPEQAAVAEINSGILAFNAEFLLAQLPNLSNQNAKAEYYLTETVALAKAAGQSVGAHLVADFSETEGANDREQLASLIKKFNQRTLSKWMQAGVTIVDPATTWIDAEVELASDVTLLPGVQLLGATTISADAAIGPDCTLRDCEVGVGAKVIRSHAELAVIGDDAQVGPFSYLRPGAQLGVKSKAGAFVEIKNSVVAAGAKVPHLSYVGDAEIGEEANLGAGTIVANYDGVNKHQTKIGARARVGSNNVLVAPVVIGEDAITGGGTVVREEVPPGALAVSAGPQRNLPGWVAARQAATAADSKNHPKNTPAN